jgi:hypothetical protein
MRSNAAAIAVGGCVLLVGLALGFVAGRQLPVAPAPGSSQEQSPPDAPLPEVAKALIGKWRLRSVNGVVYRELGEKEWFGPIVTEFGPDNRIIYGSWALHGSELSARLSPTGAFIGTYRFLGDRDLLIEAKFDEKDRVKAALLQNDSPLRWVVRIESISENDLTLSLFRAGEARYSRTQEEELLQVEKRRQDLMREYDKKMSKDQ